MAIHFYLDGVEVSANIRSDQPDGGLLSSFNGGAIGISTITIDDPSGTLDILGWRPFYVTEDTSPEPRLWTGYVFGRKISAADLVEGMGTARVWECELNDLNAIPGLLVMRGSSANRHAETDIERIDWMLDDATGGISASGHQVFDNGGVYRLSPNNFDAEDLRGKYPEESLQGMTLDSRVTCIYYDAGAIGQETSLWWAPPETTRGDLTAKLSNDPADLDPDLAIDDYDATSTFPAFAGQTLDRDPAGVASGVYLTTKLPAIYRTRPATASTYIARDVQYTTDRIGNATTAERRAVQVLDRGSVEVDALKVSVMVHESLVNVIREGYRIQTKQTHLPGYDDFVWMTIIDRNIKRTDNGAIDRYVLDLTLMTQAPTSNIAGGGSPSPFPNQPAGPPAVIQSVAGEPGGVQTLTLPSTPSVGNTLVVFLTGGGPSPDLATGWTDSPEGIIGPSGFYDVTSRMAWRPVTSSDTATVHVAANNCSWANLWEISGTIDAVLSDSEVHSTLTKPATVTSGSIATTGPALILSGVNISQHDWSGTGDQGIGDDAQWTHSGKHEITNPDYTSGNDMGRFSGNVSQATYRIVTAAGTYSPTFALSGGTNNFGGWGGLQIAFLPAEAESPPLPGQEQPWEVVTLDADGVATTYRTSHKFTAGSLRVRVDGTDQTGAVIAQDGSCGEFTLAFVPRSYEIVEARYQGL